MLIATQIAGLGVGPPSAPPAIMVTLAVTQTDYNLHADLVANHGWNGLDPVIVTVTVNAGIQCKASSTASTGFTVDPFPAGSLITLINKGEITGFHGVGGAGGTGAGSGVAGTAGGTAFLVAYPISVDNANGEINGGGGGGGGSGGSTFCNAQGKTGCTGCGSSTGAAGGAGYGPTPQTANGGGKGAAGGNGAPGGGDASCPSSSSGGAGGAAGLAVDGNSNVTWVNLGTINGARIN